MSNRPGNDDFLEAMLSKLPPHIQEEVRAKMKEECELAETNGAKLASSVIDIITAEASPTIKAGLAFMAKSAAADSATTAFISLMLGEIYDNKIAIRKVNAEVMALRKAHEAWVSDLLDKD